MPEVLRLQKSITKKPMFPTSYDFAFVDADKRMYQEYFELLLQLVRVGSLIVFDNVFWHGKVADPEVNDAKTASIRIFNAGIIEDKRVSISMVSLITCIFKPKKVSPSCIQLGSCSVSRNKFLD